MALRSVSARTIGWIKLALKELLMDQVLVVRDALVQWLAHGLLDAAWWQVLLFTLIVTHITITSVTVFLHRA